MLLSLLAIAAGLVILIYSADVFIDGAVALATKYHMPKMLIGALIIGVGTSAPELVVSALSAIAGSPGLALGNAYGSNIVNIMLVLGITALIAPIIIQKQVLKTDFVWLISSTVISVILLMDGHIDRLDGAILIAVLAANIIVQILYAKRHAKAASESAILASDEYAYELELDAQELPDPTQVSTAKSLFKLIAGLIVLVLSSRLIVWGAVELAKLWGLSDLIIGLTIVAVGTSLPELVSSIIAARRGEYELALGNVLGSNLFNTTGVVGLAALIAPMTVNPEALSRDTVVMCIITLVLFVMCAFALRKDGQIGRISGAFLLLCFVAYSGWLAVSALGLA
ncbi:calcium/sodium antiporter [Moraxella sp. FZFQ2102]|uniref:calcium/sodium antiporter n=1 Tax=Moraxella sp. FZFQ2102 TaxID=2953752 RepID=UPI00209BFDF1|nr:calcium/sodium antiporter [Moraxella sp. FZFQ2102]USZ15452.1 calcium/sodium antiporter [Moraxella sp. FZFQ2102]